MRVLAFGLMDRKDAAKSQTGHRRLVEGKYAPSKILNTFEI